MENKILILKENYNPFENYVSKKMSSDKVDVFDPYKKTNKFIHIFRALLKRTGIDFLQPMWYTNWKKSLNIYDKVIIFDNCLDYALLKWISKRVGKEKVVIWFWNLPKSIYGGRSVDEMRKWAKLVIFDEEYAKRHDFFYIHQFYVGPESCVRVDNPVYDLVYIGHNKNREKMLKEIANILDVNKQKYFFYLKDNAYKKKNDSKYGMVYSSNVLSYIEVIDISNNSKAILELNLEGQKGLTLRTLEALFLKKKLVTNNLNIENFDFYNSNNIFILGKDDINRFYDFLNSPYQEISTEIINDYSFKHWVKKI